MLNGCFLKDYDTTEIEFLLPINFEKLCVIAPKALQIPQWILIFQSFKTHVWISLLILNIVCGIIWYILQITQRNITHNFSQQKPKKSKTIIEFLIEMLLIMTSYPSVMLPNKTSERFFLSSCLMVNLIITGTFQVRNDIIY